MSEAHPLRAWRERQEPPLTLEGAAEHLGVSKSAVSRWETGDRKIEQDLLLRIAEKTGIPVRDLRPDLAELIGPDRSVPTEAAAS